MRPTPWTSDSCNVSMVRRRTTRPAILSTENTALAAAPGEAATAPLEPLLAQPLPEAVAHPHVRGGDAHEGPTEEPPQ